MRRRGESAERTTEVTITPHLIYTKAATLGHEDLDLLETWASNDKNFESPANDLAHGLGHQVLEGAAKALLERFVNIAEGPLAGPILALEAAHKIADSRAELADLSTEIGQEEALTALFTGPLELTTAGLGGADAGEVDSRFLDAIAGKDGLLRQYGLALDKVRTRLPILNQTVTVAVTEVSYCKQGQKCGPGENTPGIEPFLYLNFEADTLSSAQTGPGTVFHRALVMAYDPLFFSLLQFKGKGPSQG